MTPEQEEQVRRALAAAGRDAPPLPPDVAARLDEALAGLAAGQRPPHDELAAIRRRRRTRALLAAAVVCLVALGGTALVRGLAGGVQQASSAGSASSRDGGQPTRSATGAVALPRLHTRTLAADVHRLLATGGPSARTLRPQQARPHSARPAQPGAPAGGCARPATGAGDRLVAVRLDGRPATLRLGPPAHGARVARVYSCGDSSTPVATTRVPVH